MAIKQVIEFTVKPNGEYSMLAKEGFKGVNCREETKNIEMALNGETVETENTKDYYDGGMPININLNLD